MAGEIVVTGRYVSFDFEKFMQHNWQLGNYYTYDQGVAAMYGGSGSVTPPPPPPPKTTHEKVLDLMDKVPEVNSIEEVEAWIEEITAAGGEVSRIQVRFTEDGEVMTGFSFVVTIANEPGGFMVASNMFDRYWAVHIPTDDGLARVIASDPLSRMEPLIQPYEPFPMPPPVIADLDDPYVAPAPVPASYHTDDSWGPRYDDFVWA